MTKVLAQPWRLVVAAALIALACSAPATAQDQPTGTIDLRSQTAWVLPGQGFTLDLSVTTALAPDQVDVRVTIYGALRNRSDFQRSLDNRFVGPSLVLERRSLAEVRTPEGAVVVTLPVNDPQQRRYFLREGGVYPVRVELSRAGSSEAIDGFTTHLVNVPQPPGAAGRLSVATVLPVQAPLGPDPSEPFAVPNGAAGVTALAGAISRVPSLPLTLVPQPETVERLALPRDDGTTPVLDTLVNAAGLHDVVRTSWAPMPNDIYRPELTGELERQLQRGDEVLSQRFAAVDRDDWVALDHIDTRALQQLHARGVQRLVVPETNLVSVRRDTTLARPFVIAAGREIGTVPAVHADTGLAGHFTAADGGVLGAHHLIADLAVIWSDRPAQPRGVVVMPPRGWQPQSDFLNTFLAALGDSPLVAPVTLDGAFAVPTEGTRSNPLTRQLAAAPPDEAGPLPIDRIADNRRRLNGFASLVSTSDNPLAELERRLLLAESTGVDGRQRSGLFSAFEMQLGRQIDAVRVPAERSIRLASRQGEIPVSIQNDTGYPVDVVIRLVSDKLEFPDGNERRLRVERQHVTERIAVNARTSGAFPVQVTVQSPDGTLVLRQSTITIRSTATSTMGLVLTVGAGTFLMAWWARSAIKGRREETAA